MRKSIIYKLKATVRDFVTFEKLSVNNIHFGFNQSNSYYLMGKNNSVDGDVMFKFDASKYDIKDGNVTFWVWSPDIPSLGSVPILASSTQDSAQSQTGNAPKLGYSSATAESPRSFYIPVFGTVKIPYIYLEVTNSFAFRVTIRVKLFDPNDNPIPYKKIRIIVRLYGGTLEWVKDTIWGIIFAPKVPLYNNNFQNCTDFNGERIIQITLNVSPYIKFGTLYVYASFEEDYWLWWPLLRIPAGTIYTSLTMLVGKKVTILTNVDQILDIYNKRFTNSTEKVEQLDGVNVTTYMYDAILGKTKFIIRKDRFIETIEKYIEINFKMKLGPRDKRTGIEETKFNFIMDLNNRSNKNAKFGKIYKERLKQDLNMIVNANKNSISIALNNAFSRTSFKREWQLSYPEWDFGKVKDMYKKYILTTKEWPIISRIDSLFSPSGSIPPIVSWLTKFTSIMVSHIYPFPSPATLYSLTLTTGDYRYILIASLGSIFTIGNSLALGLNETKVATKVSLEREEEDEKYKYETITEILIEIEMWIIGTFVNPIPETIPTYKETIENDIRAIVSIIISGCISETFLSKVESKYYDLRQRAYSPQNLQKLVEIIQYDLTLLNYEIILWDQLKD